jgi:hypothetical protein
MRILMQESATSNGLQLPMCDVAIVGDAVDERGRAAIELVNEKASRTLICSYKPDSFEIVLDAEPRPAEAVASVLAEFGDARLLLDATTLGFAEVFLLCRAWRLLQHRTIHVLYVEPRAYRSRNRTELMHRREFELSDEVNGYRAIPGAISMLSDYRTNRVVFFLGYEERRLDRALEDFALQPSRCSVVFGVPAFRPGWEMDSFANNVRVMKDRGVRGSLYYCGAESPAGAMEVLLSIKRELGPEEKLFVAPIGTKPNGVGVALFAAEDAQVGVLYDHPQRKQKRSNDTGRWHLYEARFTK